MGYEDHKDTWRVYLKHMRIFNIRQQDGRALHKILLILYHYSTFIFVSVRLEKV